MASIWGPSGSIWAQLQRQLGLQLGPRWRNLGPSWAESSLAPVPSWAKPGQLRETQCKTLKTCIFYHYFQHFLALMGVCARPCCPHRACLRPNFCGRCPHTNQVAHVNLRPIVPTLRHVGPQLGLRPTGPSSAQVGPKWPPVRPNLRARNAKFDPSRTLLSSLLCPILWVRSVLVAKRLEYDVHFIKINLYMKNELVPSQSACVSMFVNISEMISSITSSMDALVMSISVRVAVVVAVSVVTVVTVAVAMVVIVVPLVLLGLVVLLLVTVVVKLVTNAVVWTTEVMDLVLVAVVLMEVALAAVPELWLAATLVSESIPGSLCWSDLEMANHHCFYVNLSSCDILHL